LVRNLKIVLDVPNVLTEIDTQEAVYAKMITSAGNVANTKVSVTTGFLAVRFA